MTPTDTDTLDLLTAKALAWETLTPKGKADCVWPHDWAESEIEAFLSSARAVRLAHAKAGVQSVPVVATEGMLKAMQNADYHGYLYQREFKVTLEASPYRTEVEP